jgi:hypothetical protein
LLQELQKLRSQHTQIALFGLAAVFSGTWLGLWLRLRHWKRNEGADEWNDRIWLQLGRYCAFACAASVSGAAAFSSRMETRNLRYAAQFLTRGDADRTNYELGASESRVFVVSDICRPVEYFCMFVALGVLLQRIVRHASHSYYTQARHHVDGGWELRDCIGECVLYPPCVTRGCCRCIRRGVYVYLRHL